MKNKENHLESESYVLCLNLRDSNLTNDLDEYEHFEDRNWLDRQNRSVAASNIPRATLAPSRPILPIKSRQTDINLTIHDVLKIPFVNCCHFQKFHTKLHPNPIYIILSWETNKYP